MCEEVPTGWRKCFYCGGRYYITEVHYPQRDVEHSVECPYCHKESWTVPSGTTDYLAQSEESYEKGVAAEAARPRCKKCGAKMIKRENSRTGEWFWGCSKYPKCTYTLPLDGSK